MTVRSPARLGPLDYLVLEFGGDVREIPGAVAAELASLIENGIVRVLEVLIARKGPGGAIDVTRVGDESIVRELDDVRTNIAEVLGPAEVAEAAAPIAPGRWAVVFVVEHRWALPLVVRTQRSGGQLAARAPVPPARIPAMPSAAVSSTTDDARRPDRLEDDQGESSAIRGD